jgi:integrase
MPTYSVIPQSSYDKTKSGAILKYVNSFAVSNKRTSIEYFGRLLAFEQFINENYDFTVDDLVINKIFSVDIYDLLSSFVTWLSSRTDKDGNKLLSPVSIKNRVINVKNLLEYYDIAINPHKFKLRVKLPRVHNQYKEALIREDIIKILETCESYKLKTYLILLAVTGLRASEACSIRLKDIDYNNHKINVRAEFTKTKVGRYCFMTYELENFLKIWIDYKYRRRRLKVDNVGSRWVIPNRIDDDLVFSSSFTRDGSVLSMQKTNKKHKKIDKRDLVGNLYNTMVIEFNDLLRQLDVGYEDNAKKRHIFTLHSFRRYVRTLISDLGYQDFAEWTLGHSYSTYWRKSEKEKYALFKKIEPHLMLLDQTSLRRQGADMQTRLEAMERENQELRIDRGRLGSRLDKLEELYQKLDIT